MKETVVAVENVVAVAVVVVAVAVVGVSVIAAVADLRAFVG